MTSMQGHHASLLSTPNQIHRQIAIKTNHLIRRGYRAQCTSTRRDRLFIFSFIFGSCLLVCVFTFRLFRNQIFAFDSIFGVLFVLAGLRVWCVSKYDAHPSVRFGFRLVSEEWLILLVSWCAAILANRADAERCDAPQFGDLARA